MPTILWNFYTLFIFLLGMAFSANANPIIYNKRLNQSPTVNLSGLFLKDYSEVRWDSNADGVIDQWLVGHKERKVLVEYEMGKPKKFRFSRKLKNGTLYAFYLAGKKAKAVLTGSFFVPNQKYFNESIFDPPDEMSCLPGSKEPIIGLPELASVINTSESQNRENQIKSMIDPSCKQLPAKDFAELESNILSVYNINAHDSIEKNNLVMCIARHRSTSRLVPEYIAATIKAPTEEPKLRITCPKSTNEICGKASYEEASCLMTLPITSPPCTKNTQSIFHENLHRVAGEALSERDIQDVSTKCLSNEKIKSEDNDTDPQGFIPNPAEATQLARKHAQDKVTVLEKEIPIDSFQPENVVGADPGGSLNSGFQRVDSGIPVSNYQAMTQSQARTSPILSMVDSIFRNVVPSAYAKTTTSSTATASSVKRTYLEGTPSTLSNARSRSALLEPNPNVSVDDATTKTAFAESEKLEAGSQSRSPASQEIAGNRSAKGASESSSSTALMSGQKRTLDVSSGGRTAQKTAPNGVSESQALVERLNKMPSKDRWVYILKNEKKLKSLKIHVLDSQNRAWGEKDPQKAIFRLREHKQRLVSEDE